MEKREREAATRKALEAAEQEAAQAANAAKSAARKAAEEAERLTAEAAAKQAEAEMRVAAAKAEVARLNALVAAAAAKATAPTATSTTSTTQPTRGTIDYPSTLTELVAQVKAEKAAERKQRLVMDCILVPPRPYHPKNPGVNVNMDVEMLDSVAPQVEETLRPTDPVEEDEEDPKTPGLMDHPYPSDDDAYDVNEEDDEDDPPEAAPSGQRRHPETLYVEDMFTANGPMTKLARKFVHSKDRGSPPLESEDSSSDFAETQQAAKLARGRHEASETDMDDDDELAAEAVESSPARRSRAWKGKGKEVVVEDPANEPSAEEPAHDAPVDEPPHAAADKIPAVEPANKDTGDVEMEGPQDAGEEKGGRPSIGFKKQCRTLHETFTKMVKIIAEENNKTEEQVLRTANLNYLTHKAPNFWNDFQAFKRLVAPDEVVGKGGEYNNSI